jgi:hypothetical protein
VERAEDAGGGAAEREARGDAENRCWAAGIQGRLGRPDHGVGWIGPQRRDRDGDDREHIWARIGLEQDRFFGTVEECVVRLLH